MAELHLALPAWLFALVCALWAAQLMVSWRLKVWTKRATLERQRSNDLRRKEQMDRAFGRTK